MHYGKKWRIDGLIAGFVMRAAPGGNYKVVFERENASLEQIEAINWAKPVIEYIGPHGSEPGLPEGYGFDVVGITYDSRCKSYTVELMTASQYLGDVTGYQEEIAALNGTVAEKNAAIANLQEQLAEADELAIALYEAQTAAEDAPAESDAEEVTGE